MRWLAEGGRWWRRTPRPVRRLLRMHPGETGAVLYRWSITRSLPWPVVPGWELVGVTVARPGRSPTDELSAWFDDARRGRERAQPVDPSDMQRGELRSGPPTWMALDPGRHTFDFHGAGTPLRAQTVRLGPGDRFLIALRAPIWLPFRRPLPARWSLRLLPDEPT